jgi:hypothetical protein
MQVIFDATQPRVNAAKFGRGVFAFVLLSQTVNADVTDEDRRYAAQMFNQPAADLDRLTDEAADRFALESEWFTRLERGAY